MPSFVDNGYEITKDPFAIFSFALLITTIALFLFLLLVTARRSSIDIWDSLSHRARRNPRGTDAELANEAAVPLMNSFSTKANLKHGVPVGSTFDPSQASKRVRFSETIDLATIQSAPEPFDEVFDTWHTTNAGAREVAEGKRKSVSEGQLAELHL